MFWSRGGKGQGINILGSSGPMVSLKMAQPTLATPGEPQTMQKQIATLLGVSPCARQHLNVI